MMEEDPNVGIGIIEYISEFLDAILANPEPIAAVGVVAALVIGMLKRFGGGRFVLFVESLPIVSNVTRMIGEVFGKVADLITAAYDSIKRAQDGS
jgi:hypothetical protein